MGFLKDLVGIAAPIAGTFLGGPMGGAIGGALGGMVSGSGQPKSQTSTTQQQLDPRISNMLFGNGGADKGLLAQYQGLLNAPQSDASKAWAGANADFLTQNGAGDLSAIRNSAMGLMGGSTAPMMTPAQATGAQAGGVQSVGTQATLPAYAVGNSINAPSQNGVDLSSTFQSLLGGGNSAALMKSLQAGNDLTSAQFQQNQSSLTDNLQRNVLPGIRSGALGAGQYGGSRQGIAEGLALSDYTKQLTNANTQLGLANSANTSGQLAGAYESGQNRALAAAQGLSAQQYNVAAQNAATKNQAEFMNVGNMFDASKTNAGMSQQNQQFNANQGQQNNQFNAGLGQQTGQFNAGLQQQGGLANQQSQLTTNGQNNSAAAAGSGLLGGLLGQAGSAVNAQDNYVINKAQGVNSLLAPYLGVNGSTSSTQPLYNNQTGNALGGAMLGGQLAGMFGGSSSSSSGGLGDLFGIGTKGGGLFGSGSFF